MQQDRSRTTAKGQITIPAERVVARTHGQLGSDQPMLSPEEEARLAEEVMAEEADL